MVVWADPLALQVASQSVYAAAASQVHDASALQGPAVVVAGSVAKLLGVLAVEGPGVVGMAVADLEQAERVAGVSNRDHSVHRRPLDLN